MQNVDPFQMIFERPYGMNLMPTVLDALDQAVGVLRDPDFQLDALAKEAGPTVTVSDLREGYVFIAMPMSGGKPSYDDVHDTIKRAASNCRLQAERIDDVQSNDRITDRLLESIRQAEFVVADLTDGRPNVFYEAGYAFGVGKIPIYVAAEGTNLEFDIKDYPIIFFNSMRSLQVLLEQRFSALIQARRKQESPAP